MDSFQEALKMGTNYNNLWDMWLNINQSPTPKGYIPVNNYKSYPKNYFMTPENMTAVINAISPYDLFMKPDYTPNLMDYPSSAFNVHHQSNDLGIPYAILQSIINPQSKLSGLRSINETAKSYPTFMRPFLSQAIYEHEIEHYLQDKQRLLQEKNISKREKPAEQREDRYWQSMGF